MQEVHEKYIEEAHPGEMGGKKVAPVAPSSVFCTKFERFENALAVESKGKGNTPEVLRAAEILANVRSHFSIVEKNDDTTWGITRRWLQFWGSIVGNHYVYIKGGPVDVEALRRQVSQVALTAIPVPSSGTGAPSGGKPSVSITPPASVPVTDEKKEQFKKELRALCSSPAEAFV
jgi:hypothetical protein